MQHYQERNKPEYIQKKEREKLEKEGVLIDNGPTAKKFRRAGSVEPLERPASSSPLPDLPEDLKHKQVETALKTEIPYVRTDKTFEW